VAHRDRALHRCWRNALATHIEVHVDSSEYLGVGLGTFGRQFAGTPVHIVAAMVKDREPRWLDLAKLEPTSQPYAAPSRVVRNEAELS